MTASLQESQQKQSNILKIIKIEGVEDERREVIVFYKTAILNWEGFKSLMILWSKVYGSI